MAKMFLAALVALVLFVPMSVCGQACFLKKGENSFLAGVTTSYAKGITGVGGVVGFSAEKRLDILAAYQIYNERLSAVAFGWEVYPWPRSKSSPGFLASVGNSVEIASGSNAVPIHSFAALNFVSGLSSDVFFQAGAGLGVLWVWSQTTDSEMYPTTLGNITVGVRGEPIIVTLGSGVSYVNEITTWSGFLAISLIIKKPEFRGEAW